MNENLLRIPIGFSDQLLISLFRVRSHLTNASLFKPLSSLFQSKCVPHSSLLSLSSARPSRLLLLSIPVLALLSSPPLPRVVAHSPDTPAASMVAAPSTREAGLSPTVHLPVSIVACQLSRSFTNFLSAHTDSGGDGGLTVSGLAKGGNGLGGGGTAVSGSTGSAYGGNAGNQAYVISNGFKASECRPHTFCSNNN